MKLSAATTATRLASLSAIALLAATLCDAQPPSTRKPQPLDFAPYHADGIYTAGEHVGWIVTPHPGVASTVQEFSYTIRKNNAVVLASGHFNLSDDHPHIDVVINEPAMIYVEIDAKEDAAPTTEPSKPSGPPHANRVASLGAAVDPTKLQPATPSPADFWSFWSGQLQQLRQIPIHPVLTPVPSPSEGVTLYTVKLDSVGSHVQGYLAKPNTGGKFPALVIYQYAGVYKLQPSTVTSRASQGWLALDVDSHDISPDTADGVQRDYQTIGNEDRDQSYFLKMYLRDTRAIDYIRSSPDWDGKTIVIMGTSMGGQQSLVTAGLNPESITAVLVNEPAGADSNGDLHGRKAGYPNWPSNDPAAMKTGLYFDTVNFASHIKAPTLAAMGFIDTTAPPVGIWTALNQIPGAKEPVPMVDSDHNNITPDKQAAYNSRSEEVLTMLLHGEPYHPAPKPH